MGPHNHISLTANTLSILAKSLGYPELQDWQVTLTQEIIDGKDVVFTAGTGCGKTTLLYAPLLAFRLQDTTAIGLSITPTKALGRDQECSARSKGIPAIAIDEDTASHASHNEHRDLVKEVMGGKYGLVIVSPEMLTSERLKPLLADPKFRDRLRIVFVDECHLVEEQGADFRPCYKEIGRLRHRLPSSVPWVAVSATLPIGKTFDRVMASLGFNPGCYIHTHLPIDNPHICYIPRFFQYPVSADTFLDISWLIPSAATSATDITKSLIFCNTINLGTRVYRFLKRLLPQSLSPKEIILPYHSLISDQGRLRAMERFRTGTTRIIVASDCFTWGVDVSDIRQVIVFDVPSSFSKLVQQMGRAGRDKKPATAITYASRWVRDVTEDSKGLKGQKAADLKRRESMCQLLRTWFNPPEDSCPRDVFCRCFGDDLFHPPNCCIKHSNVLPDLEPEPSRVEAFTAKHPKDPVLRSDRTHAPFTGLLQEAASDMISAWTRRTWDQVREPNSLLPPTSFLSQELQDRLCKYLHLMTTVENLSSVLAHWPQFKQYKTQLFLFCQITLEGLKKIKKEMEEKQKLKESQLLKIRLPPTLTPATQPVSRNELEGDSLEDGEPPRKRRCGSQGKSYDIK